MALIRTLQTEMNDWQRNTFGDTTLELAALGMVEEVGEAARVILKTLQNHRGANLDMLGEELADVYIYMNQVALEAGINLEEVIVQKWDKVQRRSREDDNVNRRI